jgi:hypothetical protein
MSVLAADGTLLRQSTQATKALAATGHYRPHDAISDSKWNSIYGAVRSAFAKFNDFSNDLMAKNDGAGRLAPACNAMQITSADRTPEYLDQDLSFIWIRRIDLQHLPGL